MADFSFSDDAELQQLNAQVLNDPEEFENWEKLVRAAESQEGGLNRNSSPGAIASIRDVYDKFLARFPLFFGYWKKYADLEFSIAGTEAAEMVYERGIASIGISVDLWANYCSFKVETSHDSDVIRELFERGADSVGLDFLAHPFWDKYLEFEERMEAPDRIFSLLGRIINIPMHQYARYFERYRSMTPGRSLTELATQDVLLQLQNEVTQAGAGGPKPKSDREIEQEVRQRLDGIHLETFQRTQTETTKRWTYESEIKRPYYHVTELDDSQLSNWTKYLDFEEVEGDYTRIKFLYERCLVTAANYEDFWLRYARWMLAQPGKEEEVRNIYQRASCIYVPISRPTIRIFYAQFEESQGRPDVAVSIHEAILMNLTNHVETVVSLANVHRRQHDMDSAVKIVKKFLDDPGCDAQTRGALIAEWARLIWKIKGSAEEARQVYQSNQQICSDCPDFWTSWLEFELQQPSSPSEVSVCYNRVKAVYDTARQRSRMEAGTVKDLSAVYFTFLKERGGKDAMAELMRLDLEMNGPASVAGAAKMKLEDLSKRNAGSIQAPLPGDGHLAAGPNASGAQPGGVPQQKYIPQQAEHPVNGDQPTRTRY